MGSVLLSANMRLHPRSGSRIGTIMPVLLLFGTIQTSYKFAFLTIWRWNKNLPPPMGMYAVWYFSLYVTAMGPQIIFYRRSSRKGFGYLRLSAASVSDQSSSVFPSPSWQYASPWHIWQKLYLSVVDQYSSEYFFISALLSDLLRSHFSLMNALTFGFLWTRTDCTFFFFEMLFPM